MSIYDVSLEKTLGLGLCSVGYRFCILGMRWIKCVPVLLFLIIKLIPGTRVEVNKIKAYSLKKILVVICHMKRYNSE